MSKHKIETIDEAALRAEFSRRPELRDEFSSAESFIACQRSEAAEKSRAFGDDVEAEQAEKIAGLERQLRTQNAKNQLRGWASKTDAELQELYARTSELQAEFSCAGSFIAYVRHSAKGDV